MDRLSSIIMDCYNSNPYNRNYRFHSPNNGQEDKTSYMIIPISKDSFELPVFSLFAFTSNIAMQGDNPIDAIVVNLKDAENKTTYAAIEAKIRDALTVNYQTSGLMTIATGDPTNPCYYGTHGLILDKDFMPMMMMSWIVRKIHGKNDDGDYVEFKFDRPILRIDPRVIINKSNGVERYIANKIMPTALSFSNIYRPTMRHNAFFGADDFRRNIPVKVEIDRTPFIIRKPSVPSISTTNQELIGIALNNMDEVVQ